MTDEEREDLLRRAREHIGKSADESSEAERTLDTMDFKGSWVHIEKAFDEARAGLDIMADLNLPR